MNIEIQLTPEEIAAYKEKWLKEKFDSMIENVYTFRSEFVEEFKQAFRTKSSYSNQYYLTDEFKKELAKTMQEEIGIIVSAFIKDKMKSSLKNIVELFLLDNINEIFEEVRSDIKLTSGKYEAEQHEHFNDAINDVGSSAYESGRHDEYHHK